MGTSDRANSIPSWPSLHGAGREKTHENRSQRAGALSLSLLLSLSLSSLRAFRVGMPSRLKDVFSFVF